MLLNKILLKVSRVASRDKTRQPIDCLRIEPDGSAVATNGRVLIYYKPITNPDEPEKHHPIDGMVLDAPLDASGFEIPYEVCESLLRFFPKAHKWRHATDAVYAVIDQVAGKIGAYWDGCQITHSIVRKDQPYPEWRKVMFPDKPYEVKAWTGLDLTLLVNLCMALQGLGARSAAIDIAGPEEPVMITANIPLGDGGEIKAMIMPLRLNNREYPPHREKPAEPAAGVSDDPQNSKTPE